MLKPLLGNDHALFVAEVMDAPATDPLARETLLFKESQRAPGGQQPPRAPDGYWRIVVREHNGRSFDYNEDRLRGYRDIADALKQLLGQHLVMRHADDDIEVIHMDAVAGIRATWIQKVAR